MKLRHATIENFRGLEKLEKAYMTRGHVLTGQNIAETAMLTGVDRRTVLGKLDLARLARWLKRKK